jgi:hypothetical protein
MGLYLFPQNPGAALLYNKNGVPDQQVVLSDSSPTVVGMQEKMSSTAIIDQEKSVYYRDVAIIRYNKKRGAFSNKPPGESSEGTLPV